MTSLAHLNRREFLSLAAAAAVSGREAWKARWVTVPGVSPFDYGVYHFRRGLELAARPRRFVIHVSADSRYQLFVNGERLCWGPARSDLYHWRYDTVDLARALRAGANWIAAAVWNDGRYAAVTQISHATAFLLQGDSATEEVINSDGKWECLVNAAYQARPVEPEHLTGYFVPPPFEQVDAQKYPWGWETGADRGRWTPVQVLRPATPRDAVDGPSRWMLTPRPIPFMEERAQTFARLRRAEGVQLAESAAARATPFQVPARATAKLLFDQDQLTTAYPELTVSGGAGARVTLRYAEALWLPGQQRRKGHRDEIAGRVFRGPADTFLADGQLRTYRPLFWRTFRYLELTIEAAGEPLAVEDFRSTYTGYPFERRARFDAGDATLDRILDVGWRTARLCAHETYMDCPFYEQLQYAGDTRIQCLVSLYMTGDARLMRNAIAQLDSSRTAEGLTYSRAPSALQQYIPPFSLWWIGMVHDYWRYVDDPEFARTMLPGVRAVLAWFGARQKADASLGPLPWWNYVDWVESWPRGVPPAEADGSSAPLDLQLLLAWQWAAELETALGRPQFADVCRGEAARLRAAIPKLYWDGARGLFADTPRRAQFSQHTNSLAVLAGVVSGAEARAVMERVLSASDLAPASIYFRYYLHRALVAAGMGDRYLEMLGPWRAMLDLGLTTWAERDAETTRSDCHAWGSSPNLEFFRTVLGIDSAAPGFGRVVIRPHLGQLTRAAGTMPHPKGEIVVRYDGAAAEVTLPPGVSGELHWRGTVHPLVPGPNRV